MKKIHLFFYIALFFIGCKPDDEKIDLPNPPTASFSVSNGKDANHVILTNTTPGAFLYQWDLGNAAKSNAASVEAYYPYKGTYEVSLTAFNSGGYGTAKQTVTITQDDPNACDAKMKLLTNCASKTWKLKQGEGALVVGTPGLTQVYWSNSAADFTARACAFNDEFTFTSKGEMIYDNKGDFWGDADGNGNPIPGGIGITVGCNPASAWKAPYQSWGSGTHKFSINNDNLNLSGDGVWMGLYKVGTNAEVSTPQSAVTFKIIELTDKKLTIAAVYPNLEWRFYYEAN